MAIITYNRRRLFVLKYNMAASPSLREGEFPDFGLEGCATLQLLEMVYRGFRIQIQHGYSGEYNMTGLGNTVWLIIECHMVVI